MKNLKPIALSLFCLSVVVSCTRDLGVDLPYAGDRLVLYSVLSPDSVAALIVGKTYPPTGRYVYQAGISTAVVRLYEDSVLVEQLPHQRSGRYVSVSGFKPRPGRLYYYTVSTPGFPDAYSMGERVPLPVRISHYEFNEAISAAVNPGVPARKLVCQFTDAPPPGDYYAVQVSGYSRGNFVAVNSFGLDRSDEFEDGCGFRSAGRGSQYNLSDVCLNGQLATVRIGVELVGPIQPGGENGTVDQAVVELVRANRGYFEYNRTFSAKDGLLQAFQPPQVRYSNIRGGYGIILAYSAEKVFINL